MAATPTIEATKPAIRSPASVISKTWRIQRLMVAGNNAYSAPSITMAKASAVKSSAILSKTRKTVFALDYFDNGVCLTFPVMSPKNRKKSEFGFSTIVVPSPNAVS